MAFGLLPNFQKETKIWIGRFPLVAIGTGAEFVMISVLIGNLLFIHPTIHSITWDVWRNHRYSKEL